MCKPRDGNGQVSGSVTKDTVNNGYIYLHDACMHIHEVHFYKILLLKQIGLISLQQTSITTSKDTKPISSI